MATKTVDARGKACPQPIVMTKKALAGLADNDEMVVLVDNETSSQNVQRFLQSNGMESSSSREGDTYTITVTKIQPDLSHPDAEAYCSTGKTGNHVICITGQRMGIGAEELGDILIRAFINSLKEVSPLPRCLIFYNSGINHVLSDSPVLQSIRELESLGVEVIVCGTCAKFYDQTDYVAVGTISNMYDIIEQLTSASKVIMP
ncbi:MAG: sulfurtransferase-like selenium metabolism protein YedF [Chitinivibrionales bacterium]|nr:sulfurtransferase-like selenium metabolism protein YedF [Chitinivibrionales bacterium]